MIFYMMFFCLKNKGFIYLMICVFMLLRILMIQSRKYNGIIKYGKKKIMKKNVVINKWLLIRKAGGQIRPSAFLGISD